MPSELPRSWLNLPRHGTLADTLTVVHLGEVLMRSYLPLILCLLLFCTSVSAEIIVGAGPGAGPHVKAFSGISGAETNSFAPYSASFQGGVRVATGDVNGDGLADLVTGTGPGAGPHVKVFDGSTGAELRSFFAYDGQFSGGVFVAAGDLNGDTFADIITGAGPGAGPHVKVFDGATGAQVSSFNAYSPSFLGGVQVAAGDVNNDGFADIVTGSGAGAGPHVKVFDGVSGAELRSFFAYDNGFLGGVHVAAGDIDGDGFSDIITGVASGGAPHVKVFSGQTGSELQSFIAYSFSIDAGVTVAAGDINGDGKVEIITGAGAGAGSHVKVFNGQTGAELKSFLAFDRGFTGGVFVAANATVPEPTGFVLMLAGLGGMIFRRR
jgi:hypothetical protein